MGEVWIIVWRNEEGFMLIGSAHTSEEAAEAWAESKKKTNDCEDEDHNMSEYHIVHCLVVT